MAARVPMPLKVWFRRSAVREKYMLSRRGTRRCDIYRKDQFFFHGVGVDGVYLPFHEANQFCGHGRAANAFIANDVIKMPDVPRYTRYRKHLSENFA